MSPSDLETVLDFVQVNSRFVEEVSGHPEARRDLNGAIARGELPAATELLERLHPDCEWLVSESPGTPHRGKAAFLRMVESWLEVTTQWRATPCEVVACSDGVVAEFVVSARGLATGIPTTVHGWAVLRVRDGLIANWREFTDRDAAIREAAQPLGAR